MTETHPTRGASEEVRARPAARAVGRSRVRGAFVRLALLAASFAVALAVLELALRVAGVSVPARGDAGAQALVRKVPADVAPGVEFELVPDKMHTVSYPGAAGEPPRVVTQAINALGFRGGPAAERKADGVFRIVALGDSFTFGTGVDQDETWPAYLEERLHAASDLSIEVQNWGVPAYNSRQEVGLLNLRAKAFEPDLVVLCAYINDASGEARGDAPADMEAAEDCWEVRWVRRLGLTSGRFSAEVPKTPAQARTMWLRERSRLADWMSWRLHGWLMGRVAERNYQADWSEGSPGLAMVRSALSAAAVIARREGFALHATMYPDPSAIGEEYGFAREQEVFRGLCEKVGIAFHDLVPAFDGREPAELRAHAHDKHPNALANRLVAERLAQALLPAIQDG